MGKKKGKDRSPRADSSTETAGVSCSHIRKGIEHSLLKKAGLDEHWSSCQDCEPDKPVEQQISEDETDRESPAVWMCLKCGHRGCGRSENQHAIKHYETPRSEPHCLVLSLDVWSVWCYICDDESLVTNPTEQVLDEEKENKEKQKSSSNHDESPRRQKAASAGSSGAVNVRGLSNLGNTCFFNAVVQNLSQTQFLRELRSMFFSGVVTPKELFTQVCKKAPRFKGFQQQDSQELLRYLLDGMRAEEVKRVNSGILKALKNSGKSLEAEQMKKVIKEYEKNGAPKNFVDRVFGGEMSSTVMCKECRTVSLVTEMFLDLSLPVADEKLGSKVTLDSLTDQSTASSTNPADASNQSVSVNGSTDAESGKNIQEHLSLEKPPACSQNEDEDDEEPEQEHATSVNNQLNAVSLKTASEGEMESGDEASGDAKEYTVVNQDPELSFQSLASRTAPEKQECSVESCLYQFTEVEHLTENNRLMCVTCTKRQSGHKAADGCKKAVYRDALKQMLISDPPAVLTLHLKRFQQVGYSVCKVNRHVQFPQILDLAPFCSLNCKEDETRVLYSLYGIVEHSGTMRSGHYTAYVKSRPSTHSYVENGLDAGSGHAEASKGSWFHISDSSVHPVPEAKVQGSQAYLLFYEKIS
uniref:Ubiquitin carboxyl-terminal hydrolase n=1 Tax=Cyprinus carpio carpio TaxID=630221 RepID=A0A8C1C8P2_CYPCA